MKEEIKKPTHAKPSLYAFYFEVMKEIAFKYGYNLVLHGSMNRDLDLIAIPWQEEIKPYPEMLKEMAETLGGDIMIESDDDRQLLRNKPHGRECWVININRTIKAKYGGMVTEFIDHEDPQCYIDISVLSSSCISKDKVMEIAKEAWRVGESWDWETTENHLSKEYGL